MDEINGWNAVYMTENNIICGLVADLAVLEREAMQRRLRRQKSPVYPGPKPQWG